MKNWLLNSISNRNNWTYMFGAVLAGTRIQSFGDEEHKNTTQAYSSERSRRSFVWFWEWGRSPRETVRSVKIFQMIISMQMMNLIIVRFESGKNGSHFVKVCIYARMRASNFDHWPSWNTPLGMVRVTLVHGPWLINSGLILLPTHKDTKNSILSASRYENM